MTLIYCIYIYVSRSTFENLEEVMPGCQSCLQNHEWYEHGVCSGIGADDFFATTTRFVQGIAARMPSKRIPARATLKSRLQEIRRADSFKRDLDELVSKWVLTLEGPGRGAHLHQDEETAQKWFKWLMPVS